MVGYGGDRSEGADGFYENWSSWTVMRDGVPYGQSDPARERAFEQLSYYLMYGGRRGWWGQTNSELGGEHNARGAAGGLVEVCWQIRMTLR